MKNFKENQSKKNLKWSKKCKINQELIKILFKKTPKQC